MRVVGIGASAGGLESLEQLFSALPADTGMAFVVVQHLSPDFRSMMDELIGRHSKLPVKMVDDGEPVEANRIYLIPPRKEMIIRDRRLLLTDKAHGLSLPIDIFFRSLAETLGAAINIKVTGENTHHMIEACFKGVGRSLRQAIRVTDRELPSTKGML